MIDLTALNQAVADLSTAENTLNAADGANDSAQTKFDAAQANLTQTTTDDAAAKDAIAVALQAVIDAASAVKASLQTPPTPPTP